VIYGVEGSVEGTAGARIEVQLGPYPEDHDVDGELGALRAGLYEALAQQGQAVVADSLALVRYEGDLLYHLSRLARVVGPDDARRANEATLERWCR
jgi:hypothetical protein